MKYLTQGQYESSLLSKEGKVIINEELSITDEEDIDFLVDSISLSWQFYTSFLHTIGQELNANSVQNVIKYTTAAMKPYLTKKEK